MTDLSPFLGILSAMITPSVLILVCSSLIAATSQRLNRVMDRTRKLFEQHKQGTTVTATEEEKMVLQRMLHMQTKRVMYLQKGMTCLYVALCMFILTSVVIGVIEVTKIDISWIMLFFSMVGGGLLFYVSLLMVAETGIALTTVRIEMNLIASIVREKIDYEEHKRKKWMGFRF